ncbi:E3 ubiquitin protein ligase RIE1-like [Zingiber officinale]|uniref:E3 ubiquitin protein ligase RIE1-like n=1 Tax=Zingiber officinale TaxID=94328 RepID=UPI001C4BA87B|nr:E3 ubiquitin protein ligase RIE1-like [Zingiber officinale]
MEREEDSTASALLGPVTPPPPQGSASRTSRVVSILGRAAGHRRPSMLVRETAALQLEERRANWAYSRPVVALDIAWNLVFSAVAVAVLGATACERPSVPLRLWIAGYAVQCVFHVFLVWSEYRLRMRVPMDGQAAPNSGDEDSEVVADEDGVGSRQRSFAKRCETLNTILSFLWWILGFFWIISGGNDLIQNAPRLYWLTVVFLAFDVFFTIFCVTLACVIGIALCCCLPCIIAILYSMAGQEGASDADISILPKYQYHVSCEDPEKTAEEGVMIPLNPGRGNLSSERILLHEDAECCICLTPYEDGVELLTMPCNHHFHSSCITKWLRIHATCPLCKYNILKGNDIV